MTDSPAKSAAAKTRPRDTKGHFIDVSEDQNGDELVNLKVHNPLKRIYSILDDIKKHQQTTFAFKLSIPLIALPVALALFLGFGGFQLGRLLPFCPARLTTQIGRLYILETEEPAKTEKFLGMKPLNIRPAQKTSRVILYNLVDGKTLTIVNTTDVDLTKLQNSPVAVTGNLNDCEHTLTVTQAANFAAIQ